MLWLLFSYTFQVGTWYHVAFCVESGNNAVYINGVAQTLTVTRGTSIGAVNLADCTLGFDRDSSSLCFDGKIGQVRIFDNALSSSEVTTLYEEPAASNNTLNYPAGAGCIAAYPLQTDAVDLSGNYSGASSNVTFGQPGYLTGNTDGTIPTAVAVNKEAGFSIAVSASVSNVVETFGHGLSVVPELILLKTIDSSQNWLVYTASTGTGRFLNLNTSNALSAAGAYPDIFKSVSNTTIETKFDAADTRLVFYCFASIPGYSKVGSYSSTGATGVSNQITTLFRPRYLLIKSTSNSEDWYIFDSQRVNLSGSNDGLLFANTSAAEDTGYTRLEFTDTGWYWETAYGGNSSGYDYIYLAIA